MPKKSQEPKFRVRSSEAVVYLRWYLTIKDNADLLDGRFKFPEEYAEWQPDSLTLDHLRNYPADSWPVSQALWAVLDESAWPPEDPMPPWLADRLSSVFREARRQYRRLEPNAAVVENPYTEPDFLEALFQKVQRRRQTSHRLLGH